MLNFIQNADILEERWVETHDQISLFNTLRNHFILREIFYKALYPFPHYYSYIAWFLCISIIGICGYAVIVYGIKELLLFFFKNKNLTYLNY